MGDSRERFAILKTHSALIIGATGLVGREITKLCLSNPTFDSVSIFVRRTSGLKTFDTRGILTEHIVDFDRVADWAKHLQGDVLFSAMGTTVRKAGSEEEQYKVDYQYQWDVAHAARQNGTTTYVLISSVGAKAESPFFYLRTKGELEVDVGMLGYPNLRILQPSILSGHREETRIAEVIADGILSRAEKILPRKFFPLRFKPIPAEVVAHAALRAAAKSHQGALTFGPADLWPLAEHDGQ